MAAQILRVTINGEVTDFAINARDLLNFEKEFKVNKAMLQSFSAEHLLYLMWLSATRTGRTALDFDAWVDTIEDLPEEVTPDPLAHTPAASSDSPSSPDSTPTE